MTGRDVLSFLRSSGTVREMRELDPQLTEWALSRRWCDSQRGTNERVETYADRSPAHAGTPDHGYSFVFNINDF